jgi:hypothetical protein
VTIHHGKKDAYGVGELFDNHPFLGYFILKEIKP